MKQIDLSARPFYLTQEQIDWVNATRESLSLEEKVGQLFICMGQDYTQEELLELVGSGKVGGILFRPAPSQTIRDWYAPLDAAARVPLLKAANLEEGGSGGISDGTLFGWPMLAAAADNEEDVRHFAKVCAYEGRSVGINWTYSPVADIDRNFLNPITNVRTNGSDPERVKLGTQIYVEELQKAGVAACAKHFPGDGVDFRDQHLHPSYNSLPAGEWYATYGAIYENLIQHDILSIMVGHIVQPNVEREVNPSLRFEDCLPGSLSHELLTDVLRDWYGFNGVISTDATIMGGFNMAMERRHALPAAIMAGNDTLVFNTDLREDYGYMLEAAKSGELKAERLDEAVTRILALKAWALAAPLDEEAMAETIAKAGEWHAQCADHAITLVKNTGSRRRPAAGTQDCCRRTAGREGSDAGDAARGESADVQKEGKNTVSPAGTDGRIDILPVTPQKYPKIRLISLGKDAILAGSVTQIAEEYLRAKGFAVERYDPYADDMHGTGKLDPGRLTLYLANYEHASNQTTVRIKWCDKHALDIPRFLHEEDSVFISFANPYHLMDVPRVPVYINAYTATEETIHQAIDKLMGESAFTGVSPVDAFCGLPDAQL